MNSEYICFKCKIYFKKKKKRRYYIIFNFIAVIAFEVSTANRYKLNKKYQKLRVQSDADPNNLRLKNSVAQAKVSISSLHLTPKDCFAGSWCRTVDCVVCIAVSVSQLFLVIS